MTAMYWDHKGAEQEKYNKLMDAHDNGFEFTKKADSIFYSYYRYWNDGDFPGWARKDWSLRRMGIFGWELNDKGLELQEQRVTEAVRSEYNRMVKWASKQREREE